MSSVLPTVSDKPRYVADMFGRIAGRYDLMNTLMTFGQDAGWRRLVADQVRRAGAQHILDVGTGTGGLATAIASEVTTARVVGVDFTLGMLRRVPEQLAVAGADALKLPFRDGQFDAVVSGFVVRNVADVGQAIDEQIRVLRPGGLLVILETTPGPGGVLGRLYRLCFRRVVPLLGRVITGDSKAYTYLPESTLAFLEPSRLGELIRERGLRDVKTTRRALGSVAVTTADKP